MRSEWNRIAGISLIALFAQQSLAQETYTNFYEPQTSPVVGAPQTTSAEPPTYEELTARLKTLEGKANATEAELKKLSEPKPAEKPKLPNVTISGCLSGGRGGFSTNR